MSKKLNKSAKVRAMLIANPKLTAKEIRLKTGFSDSLVYNTMSRFKAKKTSDKGEWKQIVVGTSDKKIILARTDNVNHPAHYKTGGIETIDFIEAKGLNYNLGNVIKYITRADHKGNRKEDLEKARWYLNREITNLGK